MNSRAVGIIQFQMKFKKTQPQVTIEGFGKAQQKISNNVIVIAELCALKEVQIG